LSKEEAKNTYGGATGIAMVKKGNGISLVLVTR